jgi:FMN-dependent oxidoreductase (nitrilotriacetate monooxygenase family)
MSGRELHLLAIGNLSRAGGWRQPGAKTSPSDVLQAAIDHARLIEAAKFDAVFYADILNYGPEATWPYKITEDFEPFTLTSALSTATERLGLVVTGSATFQAPFHLARQLLSLDHLSRGRAGWNVVTSFAQAAADNFGDQGVLPHDERYDRAEEALEVVKKLWDSWDEETIVNDAERGIYNDASRIHVASHHGRYFNVKGPLGASRSVQGQPVIFQAGSSSTGRAFAARHAEVIFTGQRDFASGALFYQQIHDEARRAGRAVPPLITPGLGFVVGSTDAEAQVINDRILASSSLEYQAGWLSEVEVNVIGADLDGPVPDSAFPDSTQTHQTALAGYRALAAQSATVREFLLKTISGFGLRAIGSPERLADEIQHWFEGRAADGFIVRGSDEDGQLEAFIDHVVPILRRRGLFRHDYAGTTLRDHLGLARPASRYVA